MNLWDSRNQALAYLQQNQAERLAVVELTFELIDRCVLAFENHSKNNDYSLLCSLALLKVKHLGHGSFSLILDGLGQEAGALMRPMIEYAELVTYFRTVPAAAKLAMSDKLPKAGKRAKAIGGIYKDFREHLNLYASHSSFSAFSITHLREPNSLKPIAYRLK